MWWTLGGSKKYITQSREVLAGDLVSVIEEVIDALGGMSYMR